MKTEHVVWSKSLGLIPCAVVAENEKRCLVQIAGAGRTMNVQRAHVFELRPGFEIKRGRLQEAADAD
jgi:hypothetical protein